MRYFVHARVKEGRAAALRQAIADGTLGRGSIAGGEYLRDMDHARQLPDGSVRWVEVCYCATPLEEEIPYWEEYFQLTKIMNAHDPARCRDRTGEEYWACSDCDCTERLEAVLATWGERFLDALAARVDGATEVDERL